MQKLTKREKTLLYVLLIVVIISAGIFLLIMPALSTNMSLRDENKIVQAELKTTQDAEVEYGDVNGELASAKEALEIQKNNFHPSLNPEDVDALLTSMTKEYGLVPVSLNIGDVMKEKLTNYEDYMAIQAKELEEADANADEVSVYNISLEVTGSIVNVQKLVNDANGLKSLRVSGVSYTTISDTSNVMTITFKLYMI